MTGPEPGAQPLHSQFANDPDMRELVDLFVGELPARMRAMEEANLSHDVALVKRLAHQLRGSAGGYGFPAIGQCAGRVEEAAVAALCSGTQVRTTLEEVRDLIELCRRASGGPAPSRRGTAA